jgi:hypothetical protein
VKITTQTGAAYSTTAANGSEKCDASLRAKISPLRWTPEPAADLGFTENFSDGSISGHRNAAKISRPKLTANRHFGKKMAVLYGGDARLPG